MAPHRLTKELRKLIADKTMEHRFAAEEAQLETRMHAAAEQVYRTLYGAKIIEALSAVPNEFLHINTYMQVAIKGGRVTVRFKTERPVPEQARWHPVEGFEDQASITTYVDLTREKGALAKTKTKIRQQIDGILCSVTTVKRLLEVWPEVAAFIPTGERASAGALVPTVTELNHKLGLPPGKEN